LASRKGEFISLLGPSGCGKTTVLRMVAGFEHPDAGAITIDGRNVTGLRPNQRNIGMVFQAYALFPNLTVADNVAFGLKIKGIPGPARRARGRDAATDRPAGFGDRYPFQLSGGQQQRVALARALAPQPRSCCWTSRCRRSTPRSASACARRSARSSGGLASPRSSSPMTRKRRCRSRTASS
jgi:putative spermidine/putrescine transport system ATP-binding protein